MKKLYTTLVAVLAISHFSYAQWNVSGNNVNSTNSGNLSIGTTDYYNKLYVNGGISSISGAPVTAAVPSINLFYDATAGKGVLLSWHNTVDWKPLQFMANNFSFISYGDRQGLFQDIFANIGIGTTTPAFKLDVNGVINTNGYMSNAQGVYVDGGTGIGMNSTSGTLGFRTNNVDNRMVINTSGNVGIGTITPDAKLAVNGTIHTKEINVDMDGWADYVFKPSYRLLSLPEVKNYIEKNRHLPDMPTEKDVIKNGVNLGEMVKLQTKKIEELTLYLIEKDKEVKELSKRINALVGGDVNRYISGQSNNINGSK